jgi:hypothetical protein
MNKQLSKNKIKTKGRIKFVECPRYGKDRPVSGCQDCSCYKSIDPVKAVIVCEG